MNRLTATERNIVLQNGRKSLPSVHFGLFGKKKKAEKSTKKLENKPLPPPKAGEVKQLDEFTLKHPKLEDPKPSRWTKKNIGSGLFFALSAFTFWRFPLWMDSLHEIAAEEATTSQFTIDKTDAGDLLDPTGVVENPENYEVEKDILHALAELDYSIQSSHAKKYTDWAELIIRFEALLVLLPITRNLLRKNIEPEAFFEDLHQQGFRGHGLKLGIVGEGVRATKNLAKSRISIYSKEKLDPDDSKRQADPVQDVLNEYLKRNGQEDADRLLKLHDPLGRDTAIANMVGRAVPEASIVSAYQRPGPDRDKFLTAMYEILRMPEASNAEKTAHFFKPLVQSFADSLRLIIDKGASVAIVPESLDPFNNILITKGMLAAFEMSQLKPLRKLINTTKPYVLTPKDHAQLAKFIKYMSFDLPKENVDWFKSKHWDEVLKPWKDVLDYAESKNVPVLIPAGDAWSQDDPRPNAVGNGNMMGLLDHPALMMIGGVKSNGKVTRYTSETNEKFKPFINGNGHGEISSTTKITAEPNLPRIPFFPISQPFHHLRKKLEYRNPIGNPFACADIASVIMMMKQFDKDMTNADIRDILLKTAGDTDGVPEMMDYVETGLTSVTYRLWRSTEKLKKNIDPVNMNRFIQQLEEALNTVLDDPVQSSLIAHQLAEIDLAFKKPRFNKQFDHFDNDNLGYVEFGEALNAVPPDKYDEVAQVFFNVARSFEMEEVSAEDILGARTDRKGAKAVRRRAAVFETIRRVKEEKGSVPIVEELKQESE